ncbi:DUF1294 domain-containing protein [Bacteroides salyersiae]|uniref:DUF1294 domain-containing protein n=1 Tax=Bacteroides salyersiae TaxID=291644 RepID=UPI001CC9C19D|nr:DUF1294 domain-containing protein [Bacteroides salyersiae]
METVFLYIYIINIITFFLYGYDKHLAVYNKWRIPEFILLLFTLLGGAFGALMGMWLFKHKTQVNKFRIIISTTLFMMLIISLVYGWFDRY